VWLVHKQERSEEKAFRLLLSVGPSPAARVHGAEAWSAGPGAVVPSHSSIDSLALPQQMFRLSAARSLRKPLLSRLLSSIPRSREQADAAKVARWGVRLAYDNTFLSYHRNAMICTAAGGALVQYHKGEGRPPLAGAGLLLMGMTYMSVGTGLYIFQISRLRRVLHLGPRTVTWSLINACWPTAIWFVSLACLLDETPWWLLEWLRSVESVLPSALQSSLFLDPPALYPVCRLLQGIVTAEKRRLHTVRGHADGKWSLTKPVRAPLTDLDVVTIILRRLERLQLLSDELNNLAQSKQSVPTAIAAPLLDKLRTEILQLEKVLEADLAPQSSANSLLWWFATLISSEHRALRDELEGTRRLTGRISAVRFTSVAFLARGQAGAAPATKEERMTFQDAGTLSTNLGTNDNARY
jgi:hypothetical protein